MSATVAFFVPMTVLTIALAAVNDGTVSATIYRNTVTNTGFEMNFWEKYNLDCYWIAIGR